jgi:S1-C subfamily serine protease
VIRWAWVLVAAALAFAASAGPPAAGSSVFDPHAVYQRAVPAVATVRVQAGRGMGIGTGFLVDRGLLLTAAHVARTAESIAVEFGDAPATDARVVGYDARRDVAALRVVSPIGAAPLEVVETESVQSGEPVVVIGTPRGVPRVMTTGEVRATNVTFPGLVPRIMILFDAGVAPGNSGGPLLNARGQVIGIVVAGTTRGTGGGLAVSGSTVRTSLPGLMGGARVERAWMGITGTGVTTDLARERRLTVDHGVLVLAILPGGPAEAAGLRGAMSDGPPGDVITSINGDPIGDWEGLLDVLATREPGERLRLGIVRGSEHHTASLVLGARP